MRLWPAAVAGALTLAACANSLPPVRIYDLGEPPPLPAAADPAGGASRAHARVYARVSAPPWLDTPSIVYRLEYDDPQRVREYAQSRWADAPARLLQERMSARLGLAPSASAAFSEGFAGEMLWIDLDEFEQVFASAQASDVRLRAQARLVELPGGQLRAQRAFVIMHVAAQADAAGAVRGLGTAADQFVDALGAWLKEQSENPGAAADSTQGAAR